VVDAVAHAKHTAPPQHVDTGSLRGDLLALTCGMGGLTDPRPLAVLSAVASAMQRAPVLFEAFSARITTPMHCAALQAFEAAQRRGELAADVDIELFSRVLPALAVHQVFLLGEPLTTERIAYLVDTVVLPACSPGPLGSGTRPVESAGHQVPLPA
jgi:Tetracyclin repressor-like, C-terminal domain